MIDNVKWSINNKCNLRCPFCFVEDVKDDSLSIDKQKKIMDKLYECGVTSIDFFGKEPLLDKRIFELMEYGKNSFYYTFITNGVNLNRYSKDIKGSPCREFSVSYDFGLKHRKFNVDLYDLKEFDGFSIEVSCDVHRDNLLDIYKGIGVLLNYNVSSVYLNPILPLGSLGRNVLSVTEQQYFNFIKEVISIKKRPYLFIKIPFQFAHTISKEVDMVGDSFYFIREDTCTAGIEHFYISSDGTAYGCVSSCGALNKTKSCNFLETPIEEVFSIIRNTEGRSCICTSCPM